MKRRPKKSLMTRTSSLASSSPETFAINVEQACALLARCTSVPAARDVRDKAATVAVYLRTKKAGIDAQNDAREVALRAERRLTELVLKDPDRAKGGRPKKNGGDAPPFPKASTLAELGVDKDEAKRLRQHASIPDDVFEDHVRSQREAGERLTLARVAAPPASTEKDYDGDESYTPTIYIEAARTVLGTIDLDPFSCELAQERVQAKRYYVKGIKGGGLMQPWTGRMWFQPPFSQPLMDTAVAKLMLSLDHHDRSHDLSACVALTNAAIDTQWWQSMADRALLVCMHRGRINFDQLNKKPTKKQDGPLRPTSGNRYSQSFMCFGEGVHADRFRATFGKFGVVGSLRFVREVAT